MQHAFCTFLCRPVVARLQHESCQLHFLSVKTRQPLPFSFSELIYRPLDSVYSRKNWRHLTKWIRWIKNDEFWSSANSLFKWRFCGRCRRHCLSSLLSSLLPLWPPAQCSHQAAALRDSCKKNWNCALKPKRLSLIHIWRCRRIERCRSRWSPYH